MSNEHRTNWDRITALTSIAIALLALRVSIWQGVVTRTHNRLSVMPDLSFELSYDPEGMSGLHLYNHGFGPARIKRISAQLDGDTLPSNSFVRSIALALRAAEPQIVSSARIHERYLFDGDVVTPNDDVILLGLPAGTMVADPRGAYRSFFVGRVKVVVEYCSFYGDCALAKYPQ